MLEERVKPISELLEILVQDIDKLTTHHFIAKNQSNYLKYLKEILKPNEAIIILDFNENYSFIVQDGGASFVRILKLSFVRIINCHLLETFSRE